MTHSQMDDATLVALTLSGDPAAYEALVIRYQSAAVGAALRVIGAHDLAEDAAQEAFVTAWMKLDVLREPAKFGVWICQYDIIRTNGKILDYQGVLAFVGAHSIPFPALKSSTNYDEKGGR